LVKAERARAVHAGLPNRSMAPLRALNHLRRSELNRFPIVNLGSWWRGPIAAPARLLPRRAHLIPPAKRAELATRFADSNDRLPQTAAEQRTPSLSHLSRRHT